MAALAVGQFHAGRLPGQPISARVVTQKREDFALLGGFSVRRCGLGPRVAAYILRERRVSRGIDSVIASFRSKPVRQKSRHQTMDSVATIGAPRSETEGRIAVFIVRSYGFEDVLISHDRDLMSSQFRIVY
jgi:hypothetical protein